MYIVDVTQSLIKKPNGDVCCVLHGQNIRSVKCIWEQRTLYDEHVRFTESVQKNYSGTSEGNTDETMRKHNHSMSGLDLNTNGISKYEKEGKYMCIAQVYLYGRNQTVNKTASIKIENIQEHTGIENQSEITSSVRASDIAEAPLPVSASGSNEQQIEEEDDYLHPYCTVMKNTIEIHEYKGIVQGIVERDGSDVVLNQKLEKSFGNLYINMG
ncbi:unnamed protein product [Mytilus edulis]|uniref:Ig-like domain-containing protein n=1 Tax=Mytilus edulis TaxID=6550 RepID=A0A8S3QJZ7_MYTED|nr:unnamed protein product [Mytilus edulis]